MTMSRITPKNTNKVHIGCEESKVINQHSELISSSPDSSPPTKLLVEQTFSNNNDAEKREEAMTFTIETAIEEVFYSGSMPNLKRYLNNNKSNGIVYILLFCIDVVLRGIAQVYLCDHPVSGIFICIGLAITSWSLLGYAILGTIFSTIGAWAIAGPPDEDITSGLCGYDGALVGCACWAFLDDPRRGGIAIVLSFVSGFVHIFCSNVLKTFGAPSFTFSFNICTTALLMAIATGNSVVSKFSTPPPSLYPIDSTWSTEMSAAYAWDMSVRGVGQFMFVDSTEGGILVILGIMISSRIGGLAAWLGGTIGGFSAFYIVSVPMSLRHLVRKGIFGYCSAGCCASLAGKVFFEPSYMGVFVGMVGAALAVLMQVTFMSFFGHIYKIPVLTWPFITTTWVLMVSKSKWLVPISSDSKTITDPLKRFIGIDDYFFTLSNKRSTNISAAPSKTSYNKVSGNNDLTSSSAELEFTPSYGFTSEP